MAPRVTIIFNNETSLEISEDFFKKIVDRLMTRLRPDNSVDTVELEIVLVGDQKIKTLNQQYLQHDYPTDVLSFPASVRPLEQAPTLGSIVISVDTAARQAKEAGITIEKEISTLTGHGLLHLLDYHHK